MNRDSIFTPQVLSPIYYHHLSASPPTSPIFLTGFMGSGKSYTGKRLAELLQTPFVDLDDRIEAAAGKTISAIFADEGEDYFRELERDELRKTATDVPTVIATGGGAPCFHAGMQQMNEHGFTVFLDPSPKVLFSRLEAGRAHRPLLQTDADFRESILQRLAARRPIYQKAQLQLRITDPNAEVARYLYDFLVDTA